MDTCKAVTQKTNIFHNIRIFQTDMDQPYDNREEILFLMAYAIWLIAALLGQTSWNDFELIPVVRTYLNNTAYALLLVKFFAKKRYTARDTAGVALVIFFCFLVSHTYYHQYIIPMIIFMCSAGNVRFSNILKCSLAIQSLMMAATITASQMGILEDFIWLQEERERHSFGYDYCAYPSHLLLFITLMWFCLRKQVRTLEILIFAVLNCALYSYTETRADLVLSFLGMFGFGIWCRTYHSKWICQLRNWITCYGFAVAAVFSILLHDLYNPEQPFMERLNLALSQRLWLGKEAIETYGFSLFGTAIRWIGQGSLKNNPNLYYNYVDCAFLKEALSYGILFLIILGILFYLVGKRIVQTEDHYLGWAIIITLMYATINAQFCMLVFNAFILVPGILFSDENIPVSSETSKEDTNEKLPKLTLGKVLESFSVFRNHVSHKLQSFCDTAGKTLGWIASDWIKSRLRTAIFLLLFIYLIFVQHQGTEYIADWSSMHIWVTNIALFLLTILCWEDRPMQKNTQDLKQSLLLTATELYLLLICISDFVLKKEFSYCGFFLLTLGGLFCRSWHTMERPEQLMEDFKCACKTGFFLTLIYCLAFRPASFDICYTGTCIDAETFGILMLMAMVVFLSDTMEKRMEYLNGTCAVVALYLVLLTRKLNILFLAGFIVLYYVLFWTIAWFRAGPISRDMRTRKLLYAIIGGLVSVLLIHHLLHFFSPLWGTQTIYTYENTNAAEITLFSFLFGELNLQEFQNQWQIQLQIWKEYLNHLNLLGHEHLLTIQESNQWPQNSLIMNLFRYGVPAGINYAVVVILYWGRSLYHSLKKLDFSLFSAAILCTGASLLGIMEMPFAQIPWILFYLNLGWMIVSAE